MPDHQNVVELINSPVAPSNTGLQFPGARLDSAGNVLGASDELEAVLWRDAAGRPHLRDELQGVLLTLDRSQAHQLSADATALGQPLWVGAECDGERTLMLVPASGSRHPTAPDLGRTDALTGLGNRYQLDDTLAQWQHKGLAANAAVLLIDLDRFKQVNDTLGHDVGDLLLRRVADRLQSTTRASDSLIRLGGDEFLILQQDAQQPKGATLLAERVIDLLSRPFLCGGHHINIGASVGITLPGQDSQELADVVRFADLAMYDAKRQGKNRYCFFRAELAEAASRRREMELDLRRALALDQFRLVFQPQIDLATRQTAGFEALIRWHHPERGLVSPAEFIPLAEELGEIVEIGRWVLQRACEEALGWPETLVVSVNASPVQLARGGFADLVQETLRATGLAPQRLEIEITEGVLLTRSAESLATLWALKDMGVGIAMDDFGTGYSSLSYLKSFPFTKLKLDQSFLRGTEEGCSPIVDAVLALGESMHMQTTAEGVESEQQFEALSARGCSQAQGYFIAKPMPPTAIEEFLQEFAPVAGAAHE